jgi:8-oxo-dGTP pyrophosphatase MutT (NUDIX family)
MAYFNKSSLCILNDDESKFLVLEKDEKEDATSQFITPGGKFENNESDSECLVREIKEELGVEVDVPSLQFINEYVDVAASDPTKEVSIRMYS